MSPATRPSARRLARVVMGVTAVVLVLAGGWWFWPDRSPRARIEKRLAAFDVALEAGRYATAVEHARAIDAIRRELAEDMPPNTSDATTTDQLPQDLVDLLARCNALRHRLLDILSGPNDPGECEAALRLAAGVPPFDTDMQFRFLLGLVLRRKGEWEAARVEFREVARRQQADFPGAQLPLYVDSRYMQAVCAMESGRWEEARDEFSRLEGEYEVGVAAAPAPRPDEPDMPFRIKHFRSICDRLVANRGRLADVLAGRLAATTPADLRDAAVLCLYSGHYTSAAGLFADYFRRVEGPTPAGRKELDAVRYFAVAAAARAGTPGDRDAAAPAAGRWPDQALTWASEDYARHTRPTAEGVPLEIVSPVPRYWSVFYRHDYFLAVVRDRPAAPGLGWTMFWADVHKLSDNHPINIYWDWMPF